MIDWLVPSRNRMGTEYMSISVTTAGGADYLQLSIRFTEDACKDLRIIEGDRVLVGVDKVSKQVCIKRVTDARASIKVSKASGKRGSSKTLRVQCKSPFPLHKAIPINKQRCHIESTHVAIDVPEFFK